jgi:hypothetical protein
MVRLRLLTKELSNSLSGKLKKILSGGIQY